MSQSARLIVAIPLFALAASPLLAADWPGFRGPRGGFSDDNGLPVRWSKDTQLWKIKLPGAGTSSPIVTGDKIIITCNAGYGTSITKGMSGGFGGGGKG